MPSPRIDVALIGYQDQGNLGMGYLAAVLRRRGYTVELIEIRDDPAEMAARLGVCSPLIIGFSLIFQAFLPQFRRVAQQFRAAGVTSHFTIGGHFASLCHDELLAHFRKSTALSATRVRRRCSNSSSV
jgi:methylmalonyl-CoA mutase cobalamin-binding subunit